MLTVIFSLATFQIEQNRFLRNFEAYPPISEAQTISQIDADNLKIKSLAKVYRGNRDFEVVLDNGVVQFISTTNPLASGTQFKIKSTQRSSGQLPPPTLVINGEKFEIGTAKSGLNPANAQGALFAKPFDVKNVIGTPFSWPPRGMGLKFTFNHLNHRDIFIEVRYQMLDREPILNQTITIRNGSLFPIGLSSLSQGDNLWPHGAFKGENINLIIRPGRVLELPEAWLTIDNNGNWTNEIRELTRQEISPWEKISTYTVKNWPAIDSEIKSISNKKYQAILIPRSAEIDWTSSMREHSSLISDFVKLAKKYNFAVGAEVDLASIPAQPEDRTQGDNSPVCWESFSGSHWRQTALLNWKRHGLAYISLKGNLPKECDKVGHKEHQTQQQGWIENEITTKNLMRNGLSLGVVIHHESVKPYGP